MNRTPIAVLAATALLTACSTELDVNAPYEDHTVVYGLLNMRDSIQFIKVNKSFLGEGNALDYAQVADSNEYGGEAISHIRVHKVTNGQRVATFDLRDTIVDTREPGTFHSPEHKLYYFVDPEVYSIGVGGAAFTVHLDQNSSYELDVVVNGRTVSAITPVVNDVSFSGPTSSLSFNAAIRTISDATGTYGTWPVRWTSNRDGKRYVVRYRFNYVEKRTDGTFVQRSVGQRIGQRVSANSQAFETMELFLNGEQFYSNLANEIPIDPGVEKRIFTGMDLLMTVANDDFHTFLSLSEPVSGIVEERPAYSNIDGAYGIWGSRYDKAVIGKPLSVNSFIELVEGPYTAHLGFCSAFVEHGPGLNGPNYCPL